MGYTSSDGNYRTEDLGTSPSSYTIYRSFPRTRGDVPVAYGIFWSGLTFPPHTRGCTHGGGPRDGLREVSPAHAGMYLRKERLWPATLGFPRTRGDVPMAGGPRDGLREVSPAHAGMYRQGQHGPVEQFPAVSPAHAGMYRQEKPRVELEIHKCFPRTRGDVPVLSGILFCATRFPPHTRGCTPISNTVLWLGNQRFPPHTRGCTPISMYHALSSGPRVFPPHTRGCTAHRQRTWPASRPRCFPRTRGDVPV